MSKHCDLLERGECFKIFWFKNLILILNGRFVGEKEGLFNK